MNTRVCACVKSLHFIVSTSSTAAVLAIQPKTYEPNFANLSNQTTTTSQQQTATVPSGQPREDILHAQCERTPIRLYGTATNLSRSHTRSPRPRPTMLTAERDWLTNLRVEYVRAPGGIVGKGDGGGPRNGKRVPPAGETR
ncbi:hypothetical protein ZHAS_00021849 [Anopheles sinensis]|uniref:Uncharacterized protein n=1 Tax=Anopheles sinensis TaxID=74873 RepID=A0A084WTR6_ANOSI|nr:hypothetical protein ZHAS_00021849 [Anopheles sinensis]